MEEEPRHQNPYELLTEEELNNVVQDWHEHQRGLNYEYGLMMNARVKKYAQRLGESLGRWVASI